MTFELTGASLPTQFIKKSNQQNSNFKQNPIDRIVIIDSYDLEDASINCTEVETNRKINVKIRNAQNAKRNEGTASKWQGNIIDARMEKSNPVGSLIALEACETVRNLKKGGEEVSLMTANWIINPPSASLNKTFKGVITVNQRNDRIFGVQNWSREVINPEVNDAMVDELGQTLDQIVSDFREGKRPISKGIMFRTLVPHQHKGETVYQMIHSSPPVDWIRAIKDGDDAVIKEGHPLDREHLEMYLNKYLDHVFGSSDNPENSGLINNQSYMSEAADGNVDKNSVVVEVMTYDAYQAAPLSDHMHIRNERHPLSRLASVMMRYSYDEDRYFVGKNWAVNGLLFLTEDQAPKERGDDWKPRNFVSRILTNGFTGNLHRHIPAFDGKKVVPHPKLDRSANNSLTDNVNNDMKDANTNAFNQAAVSAPKQDFNATVDLTIPSVVDNSLFGEDDDAEGGAYFANAAQNAQRVEEVAPAPEPAPAPAPASETSTSARFNRRSVT